MNSPKVSIIVPVYNREKCIVCCIQSILQSIFQDFEILLIDDGSTDSTSSLCEQLAKTDSRVKYYRQKNKGVSAARNYGLSLSAGLWITFIDSDCAILTNHLDVMTKNLADNIDLIMTGYTSGSYTNEEIIVSNKGTNNNQEIIIRPSAVEYLFNDFQPFENVFYPIWNKFFKRSIIEKYNLQFDESMSLGEDQVFLCNYLLYAKGIYYLKRNTYIEIRWKNLEHLGSKLRSPSDFLYNQKKNYNALCNLLPLSGQGGKAYTINYGIDRPITRILFNYTKFKNRSLVSRGNLKQFIISDIIPFLSSIDTTEHNAKNFHVRVVRRLLLSANINLALGYCMAYHLFNTLISFTKKCLHKLYSINNDNNC